jgi:hypothetical protein
MANIKSLVKDTAIYGMSSIVGRFLNYLLVPLYTHVISAASGGYGVVTNLYAYVALILVILTFGMETTFFRFANKDEENPHCVFSTSIFMVSALSALFLALVFGFIDPISEALNYTEHKEYILMLAVVVALDAFQAIPFSYLRYKKKAIKFASLKMFYISNDNAMKTYPTFAEFEEAFTSGDIDEDMDTDAVDYLSDNMYDSNVIYDAAIKVEDFYDMEGGGMCFLLRSEITYSVDFGYGGENVIVGYENETLVNTADDSWRSKIANLVIDLYDQLPRFFY